MKQTFLVSAPTGIHQLVASIKGVRGITDWGLKQSKDFVQSLNEIPQLLVSHHNLDMHEIPRFLEFARDGGLKIVRFNDNDPVRNDIEKQIKGIASWATMSDNYDIAQALISVLDMHFPKELMEEE